MKILMLKGLPASGKSTYAKELVSKDHNFVRVNKDDLRAMMNNGEYSSRLEKQIIRIERELAENALKIGKNVVVDDTNFNPIHEEYFRDLAVRYDAKFEIKFFDTPPYICIIRDNMRPNGVGETVIRRMYNQYLKPKPAVYERNSSLPNAVLCDIDGTLAHMKDRSPYDWKRVGEDDIDEEVSNLLHMFGNDKIILLSGRDSVCRKETMEWLDENNVRYDEVIMRRRGDSRRDSVVKQELFNEYIRGKYNVRFVLDDRNQVVEMWRSLGLKCLQVEDGDF